MKAIRIIARIHDCIRAASLNKRYNGYRNTPIFEAAVGLEFPTNIFVGAHVKFLRGCVVSGSGGGKVILHDGVTICRYAVIQSLGGIVEIGSNSAIGDFCNLYGFTGGLKIGSNVLLASGCRIVPSSHNLQPSGSPISSLGMTSLGIDIQDGAWLAANVVVVDGVTIGSGAVVGAGAVVLGDVPENSIVAGVPARQIGMRGNEPTSC